MMLIVKVDLLRAAAYLGLGHDIAGASGGTVRLNRADVLEATPNDSGWVS